MRNEKKEQNALLKQMKIVMAHCSAGCYFATPLLLRRYYCCLDRNIAPHSIPFLQFASFH